MRVKGRYWMAAMFALSACGKGPGAEASTQAKRIEGYGEIKFGSSSQDALEKYGRIFNSVGVSECLRDLPLKGCFLSPSPEPATFVTADGIPYSLTLSFNRYDKLTDVDLIYAREGEITRSECLEMHERTMDWVVRDYGQMFEATDPLEPGKSKRVTAGGNHYSVTLDKVDSFVTQPMRTFAGAIEGKPRDRHIFTWDNQRYVSVLTFFMIVNRNPMCRVDVTFGEPKTVERRKS